MILEIFLIWLAGYIAFYLLARFIIIKIEKREWTYGDRYTAIMWGLCSWCMVVGGVVAMVVILFQDHIIFPDKDLPAKW